jgi:hypothetical protein
MTRTAGSTRSVRPTRPGIARSLALVVLGLAAWFVVPMAATPGQAAEHASGHAVAQKAYVASLVARHDAAQAKGYTQMDDYVRGLVYWHNNPDWGVN